MESRDTDELLARARAGDAQAFCRLAARHEARLLWQADGMTRCAAVAEDLVAETMVEAWRSLPRYNGSCRFSTWLFSILVHRLQKHLRRARSRPVPLGALPQPEADALLQHQKDLPEGGLTPSDALIQSEAADELRRVIESLPDKHREVILLRFFEDASLPEIAGLLGCSVGTVKSRLHYALEKLREGAAPLNLFHPPRDT